MRSFKTLLILFRKILLALVSFLFICLPGHIALASELRTFTEERLVKSFSEIDLLDPSEAPQLFAQLKPKYELLTLALQEKLQGITKNPDLLIQSELRISKSSTINAQSFSVVNEQGVIVKVVSLISTGLINFLIQSDNADEIQQGLSSIVGVSAHEAAHAIDMADPNGLEKQLGAQQASQAIEFRTDYEAGQLLRMAGLPVDGLLQGLKKILGSQNPGVIDRAQQVTSSHPESEARLAALRLAFAADRMKNGLNLEKMIETSIAKVIYSETQNFKLPSLTLSVPKTIADLRLQLQHQATSQRREWNNMAFLWLDQQLANGNLNPKDPEVKKILRDLIYVSGWGKLCRNAECLKALFADTKIAGMDSLDLKPHHYYLNQLPVYSDENDIVDFTTALSGIGYRDVDAYHLPLLMQNIDASVGASRLKIMTVIKTLDLERATHVFRELVELPFFRQEKPVSGDLILYSHYFNTKIMPSWMKSLEPLKLVKNLQGREMLVPSFLIYQVLVPTLKSRHEWDDLFSRNQAANDQKLAVESISAIWNNRGMWAYLEFMSEMDFRIDWDFITRRLNIPRDQYKNELQKSFTLYLKEQSHRAKPFHESLFDRNQSGFIPRGRPVWMTPKMSQTITQIIEDVPTLELKKSLTQAWRGPFYRFYPEQLATDFKSAFHELFENSKSDISANELWDMINTTEQEITGFKSWNFEFAPQNIITVLNELEKRPLNQTKIRAFVDSIIAWKNQGGYQAQAFDEALWIKLMKLSNASSNKIGVIKFCRSIEEAMPAAVKYTSAQQLAPWEQTSILQSAVNKLSKALVSEVTTMTIGQINETSQYLTKRFKPNEYSSSTVIANAMVIRIKELNLAPSEKLLAFWRMTHFAQNNITDSFFVEKILPELKNAKKENIIRFLLTNERIYNPEIRVQLTRDLISIDKSELDSEQLIHEINSLTRGDSNARDQLLEEIAWQRSISGDDLETHIQDQKAVSWRKLNPRIANYTGTLSEIVKALSIDSKINLIQFLISAGKDIDLLNSVAAEVSHSLHSGIDYFPKSYGGTIDLHAKADLKVNEFKRTSIQLATESTPTQRVPAVEFLLSVGKPNVISKTGVVANLIEKNMGVKPGSTDAAVISAYADVLLADERTAHIAYLLLSGTGGNQNGMADIRAILEVFGTVGKKFGQLGSIFDVFGPQYKDQLKELLDNADKMEKIEIENLLKKRLGSNEYRNTIKRLVKVLGSASIKTVVLAELQNGKMVALMIKRPFADNQTMTNLHFAKRFLDRLKIYSVNSTNPLFAPLVDAVEAQMPDELNFAKEVKNFGVAKNMIADINRTLQDNAGGWNMSVPNVTTDIPISSDLFALDVVTGISAKMFFSDASISKTEKDHVGRLLLKASLAMLFRYGTFDPDRHQGNWLIDRDHKKISFIDAGQLMTFPNSASMIRFDGKLSIAQFLKAIGDRNSTNLVSSALNMRKIGDATNIDTRLVASKIEKIFSSEAHLSESDLLKKVLTELYENKIELDHIYTFGALKGLLVLSGSEYLNQTDFKSVLTEEVKKLYLKKAPAIVLSKAQSFLNLSKQWFHQSTDELKMSSPIRCQEIL